MKTIDEEKHPQVRLAIREVIARAQFEAYYRWIRAETQKGLEAIAQSEASKAG